MHYLLFLSWKIHCDQLLTLAQKVTFMGILFYKHKDQNVLILNSDNTNSLPRIQQCSASFISDVCLWKFNFSLNLILLDASKCFLSSVLNCQFFLMMERWRGKMNTHNLHQVSKFWGFILKFQVWNWSLPSQGRGLPGRTACLHSFLLPSYNIVQLGDMVINVLIGTHKKYGFLSDSDVIGFREEFFPCNQSLKHFTRKSGIYWVFFSSEESFFPSRSQALFPVPSNQDTKQM